MAAKTPEFRDLTPIVPAMLRDFGLLGIRSVAALAKQDPQRMYEKLGRVVKQRQDICVLDVFYAALAQARNPRLTAQRCQWWWWSEQRKNRSTSVNEGRNNAETERSRGARRV